MTRDDDRALLTQVGHGDLRAFDVLARRWQGPLYRFLLRLTGARLAEDARQQTLLRIFTQASGYRGGSVKSWVFRVAYSVGINALRAETRRSTVAGDLPPELPSRSPTPLDVVVQRDEQSAVRAALDLLPPEDRTLLWLRAAEGLRFTEIAAVTGIPASTLRYRFACAVRELRRRLDRPLDCGTTPLR